MLADVVFDALRPFHLWAQVAAICAIMLGGSAALVLVLSPRLSRRWWLGLALFASCLIVVAFGERSRMAARDLRPYLVECLAERLPNCGSPIPTLSDAAQRATLLGIAVVVITALGLAVALIALRADWRTLVARCWTPLALPSLLLLGLAVAAFGAFVLSDGVAGWLAYAYLADIRTAGDALGQLPLVSAIIATVFGALVLACGSALVLAGTPRRRVA